MAFAVHINRVNCTGYNNCVVACPVDALELHSVDPSIYDTIFKVRDGKSIVPDFRDELCTGNGVCVKACPHDVIKVTGSWESKSTGKRTIMVLHEG